MSEALAPAIQRSVWFASALLLILGSLMLTFGVGWAAVEVVSAIQSGVAGPDADQGRAIIGAACVALAGGLLGVVLLRRLESDERSVVQIDFDRPIVGFHGRRLSKDRWRIEARISVLARRAVTAVIEDRADDIARAAAEALALLGPRAAHRPDRARAERALTDAVNRALRVRIVRSIRIREVDFVPAL